MIILDSTSKKLSIYLAGAKATNDATWVVAYADTDGTTITEVGNDGSTNGTAKVDMVAAPASGHRRIVKSISIYNADTANIIYYLALYNGSVYQIIDTKTLTSGSVQPYGMGTISPFNQGCNIGDSPTFANIIDSGLTISQPVVTDASKKLASLAYTGATSFRKNLGLETSDSPTFAGLTVDTNTLHVDSTNHRLGIGVSAPKVLFHIGPAANSEFPAAPSFTGAGFFLSSSDTLFGLYAGASGTGAIWLQVGRNDSATYYDLVLQHNGGNVGIGKSPNYLLELNTDSAGKPGVGGLWTVVSDTRLKQDIALADLDRCYEIVKSIPLKRFTWRDDALSAEQVKDRSSLGWVADDVKSIFPKSVGIVPFAKVKVEDGTEEIQEQVMEDVKVSEAYIEVVDGKPVQKIRTIKRSNSVFDDLPVTDETGKPIFDVLGHQMTYPVPRMKTTTKPKFKQDKIEDCLDLNGGQLIAAMYGTVQLLQKKVEALESKSGIIKGNK